MLFDFFFPVHYDICVFFRILYILLSLAYRMVQRTFYLNKSIRLVKFTDLNKDITQTAVVHSSFLVHCVASTKQP